MRKTTTFVLLILFIIGLSGCQQMAVSEVVAVYQENHEIIGSEREKIIGTVSDTIYETSDRSNKEEVPTEFPIERRKGAELSVPEGRYEITGNITGNIFIYDEKGDLLIREILGYGIHSITVDVKDTHRIVADGGFEHAMIMPVGTQINTILSAGIWDVGLDIEPGEYTVKAPSGGLGYLQIFDPKAEPRVFEVIGGSTTRVEDDVLITEFHSYEFNVLLEEGQKLKISQISMLEFLPVEE